MAVVHRVVLTAVQNAFIVHTHLQPRPVCLQESRRVASKSHQPPATVCVALPQDLVNSEYKGSKGAGGRQTETDRQTQTHTHSLSLDLSLSTSLSRPLSTSLSRPLSPSPVVF